MCTCVYDEPSVDEDVFCLRVRTTGLGSVVVVLVADPLPIEPDADVDAAGDETDAEIDCVLEFTSDGCRGLDALDVDGIDDDGDLDSESEPLSQASSSAQSALNDARIPLGRVDESPGRAGGGRAIMLSSSGELHDRLPTRCLFVYCCYFT